jgi:CRP/FNR family nitrogen fixation transcriptional regulator
VLPVSRYDIADYLAVSVETVSRSLTDLKQRGVIKLSGTRVLRIVNREALEDTEHDTQRLHS